MTLKFVSADDEFQAYLSEHAYRTAAYVVDDAKYFPPEPLNRPVILTDRIQESRSPDEYCFAVGWSFQGVNAPRAAKYREIQALGYAPLTFVHRRATLVGDPFVGDGSFIMDENTIQPGCEIGENCILWSGNHIGHDTKIGNHVFIASHAVISGDVTIGDRCFIGVNATIRDGVTIGEGCVIGAGAIILHDCEPDGLYPGVESKRSQVPASRLRRI